MTARWRRRGSRALLAVVALAGAMSIARAQTVVHGADSIFVRPDLKLAWAIDRGVAENKATVVIRVVNVAGDFRYLRIDGVDPFTKSRAILVEPRSLSAQVDLSISRARFADFPSMELHPFRTEDTLRADRPALTIFYLGVPDTTPEFPTVEGVRAYFERTLSNLRP